jgi:hypothetical protein
MFSMAVFAMRRRSFAAAAALALSIRTLASRTRSRGAIQRQLAARGGGCSESTCGE